jgi:hypothetical protein
MSTKNVEVISSVLGITKETYDNGQSRFRQKTKLCPSGVYISEADVSEALLALDKIDKASLGNVINWAKNGDLPTASTALENRMGYIPKAVHNAIIAPYEVNYRMTKILPMVLDSMNRATGYLRQGDPSTAKVTLENALATAAHNNLPMNCTA